MWKSLVGAFVVVLATGCFENRSQLVATVSEPPGVNCANGGVAIETGLDDNGDGVLEGSEVTSISYVCSPANAPADLLKLAPEPPGANCANGGEAVESGLDSNGDGVLEESEVTSVAYICAGSNGTQPLVRLDPEPPGMNCSAGGTAIHVGFDTNGDGVLEDSEITSTSYVCGNGQQTLIRVDDEPPGANCANGGTAIHAGLDANSDGILEDDEIQTTSYVCSANAAPSTIYGSFTIQNSLDAAQLDGVQTITGDLIIDADGTPEIDLPTLQHVGGTISIPYSGTIGSVNFASLTTAGAIDIANESMTSLAMPELQALTSTSVPSTVYDCVALTAIDLSSLATIEDGLTLEEDGFTSVALPSLVTLDSELDIIAGPLTSIDLGALTTANSLHVTYTAFLTALSLPKLTSVSGDLSISVNDRLASISAPLLSSGAVVIDDNAMLPSLSLPALASGSADVTGNAALTSVELAAFGSGSLTAGSDAQLETLAMPVLSSVGLLTVTQQPELTTLSLPEMATVTGDVTITQNTMLGAVSLPALTTVGGKLDIENDPAVEAVSLPALQAVGLALYVSNDNDLATIDLSGLTTGSRGLLIQLDPVLTSASLSALESADYIIVRNDPALLGLTMPKLTAVGSTFEVDHNDVMATLTAPELLTAGNLSDDVVGEIYVVSNPALTAFSLPSLISTSELQVESNASLATFSAPVLTTCNGLFYVDSDPALPLCQVQAVLTDISPAPEYVNDTGDSSTCM